MLSQLKKTKEELIGFRIQLLLTSIGFLEIKIKKQLKNR